MNLNQLLSLLIILLPLTMYGLFLAMQRLVELIKVRRGYYRVVQFLPNGRKRVQMAKPERGAIKLKDGIYPFSNAKHMVTFTGPFGNVPEIGYVNGVQVDWHDIKNSTIDAVNLSQLAFRTYNLGATKQQKMERYFLLLLIVAAAAAVITLLLFFSFTKTFDSSIASLSSQIAEIAKPVADNVIK